MALLRALINKETLKKICEEKNVQTSYIASKIGCTPPNKINEWLDGGSYALPTFNQAKKIASCLHIPFAGLYMNPDDVPIKKIPNTIINRRRFAEGHACDESSLNIAIIDLLEARDLFLSTMHELNEPICSFNVTISMDSSASNVASEIRKDFCLDLDEQFKSPSPRQFYLYLRRQIEAKGVFIHCFTDVDIELVRGIAIYDKSLPIIGINEKDRPPAKSFSIIHELVHLLKRQSSLCNEFLGTFSKNAEEVFCNSVAGELLVPTSALFSRLQNKNLTTNFELEDIQSLAKDFSVSKEVISRRLLDNGVISEYKYLEFNNAFRQLLELEKEERKLALAEGRISQFSHSPSREAIDRTSSNLCRILAKGYYENIFSKQDVTRYLGINQKYADLFLREVSKW